MTAILHHIDGQLKENIYGEYSFVERLQYNAVLPPYNGNWFCITIEQLFRFRQN